MDIEHITFKWLEKNKLGEKSQSKRRQESRKTIKKGMGEKTQNKM